jgi:hypothetical protein
MQLQPRVGFGGYEKPILGLIAFAGFRGLPGRNIFTIDVINLLAFQVNVANRS